jgi:hypothetical protein
VQLQIVCKCLSVQGGLLCAGISCDLCGCLRHGQGMAVAVLIVSFCCCCAADRLWVFGALGYWRRLEVGLGHVLVLG